MNRARAGVANRSAPRNMVYGAITESRLQAGR